MPLICTRFHFVDGTEIDSDTSNFDAQQIIDHQVEMRSVMSFHGEGHLSSLNFVRDGYVTCVNPNHVIWVRVVEVKDEF